MALSLVMTNMRMLLHMIIDYQLFSTVIAIMHDCLMMSMNMIVDYALINEFVITFSTF